MRPDQRPAGRVRGGWHIVILATALLLLLPGHAFAYTDPGSGALLWQMAAAALFGAAFYGRRLMDRVRALLGRRPPDEPGT